MANVQYSVARKVYKCSKCGEAILKGQKYARLTFFRQRPIIRCSSCGFKSYETYSSDYSRSVGKMVEYWQDDYQLTEDVPEILAANLEDIKSDCEDRLDNIPEQLREGDVGSTLQERIDSLDEVISELYNINYDDYEEESEFYRAIDDALQEAVY